MSTIKLYTKTSRIVVKQTKTNIRLTTLKNNMKFKESGRRGLQGIPGPAGPGLPAGGVTDQLLAKASDDDYDLKFVYLNDIGDKNFVMNFNVSTSVTVNHNLNKYPSVTVTDSAGDEIEGVINHLSVNSLMLTFAYPFSGRAICN